MKYIIRFLVSSVVLLIVVYFTAGFYVAYQILKRGVDPKKHCDEMAPRFIELWEKLHIKYDDFIRTTEKRHTDVVKKY